jgi:hypothetical protein
LLLVTVGCSGIEDEDIASSEAALVNGFTAESWMWRQAVKPNPCTATLISPRHAILALHCTGQGAAYEGTPVRFYTNGPVPNEAVTRTIVDVLHPPGTHRPGEGFSRWDDFGVYGDMAILELDEDAPATSVVSVLAWRYPGQSWSVIQVGAGNHDGVANVDDDLRWVYQRTGSADDVNGLIHVTTDKGNPQDSGGPLYMGRRVLGVFHGGISFTSVPRRLDWILGAIGWSWPHGGWSGAYRYGTVIESFTSTERVCQYACDMGPCEAYNWAPGTKTCELVEDVAFSQPSFSWHSDFDATP